MSPPDAAAADTSAVIALFRGGMADVAAGGKAAGLDADDAEQMGAAIRRWAEATATTDLADIPSSYVLLPPPPVARGAEEEAAGGKLERGGSERVPSTASPPSSSSPRGYPRGHFLLAVDVASGAVLGCVGGKPPKVPAGPPTGMAGADANGTNGSGGDANGGGNDRDGQGGDSGGEGTGRSGGRDAGADSGGGVCKKQDRGGPGSGGGDGAQPPSPQLSVELVRMAVATDARRRGIGRALVTALHAAVVSEGVDRVNLTTLSTMVSAMRLYASSGYRETFRVPLSQIASKLDVPSSVVGMAWERTRVGRG